MTQRSGTTMPRVSFQTHSRFTLLSDTFRTVRIVFGTVAFNDTGKKGRTKTKTEALRDTSRWRRHHLTPPCAVSRQAEPPRRSPQRQSQTNRNGALAAEGARSWRPEFDLGWACSGLPLNAGRDPHRAACETWSRLMRKRKHSSWQKSATVVSFHLAPSIYGFLSLSLSQHSTDSSTWREHSSQRLLSFSAPFQNFNLISLSVFMSLFVAQQTGPFETFLFP